MIKSPISYPGGKFKAMPQIMPLIPSNVKDWREPFFGGGSVTMYYLQECLEGKIANDGKKRVIPETLTVGDLNPEIWNLWEGCKTVPVDAICEVCRMAIEKNTYYYPMFDNLDFENVDVLTEFKGNGHYVEYMGTIETLVETVTRARENAKAKSIALLKEHFIENAEENIDKYMEVVRETRGDIAEIARVLNLTDSATDTIIASAIAKLGEAVIGEAKEMFSYLKNMECEQLSMSTRCARQYLVNKISFSGMGDAGSVSKDQFMGYNISQSKRILSASSVLQRVTIKNVSFEEIMRLEPQGTATADEVFIFLDPPYYTQESSGLYGKDGEMHKGFPHQFFIEECLRTNYKYLITYDDSVYIRRAFRERYLKQFKLTYTMAGQTSSDALAGEEIFIANYDMDKMLGITDDLESSFDF